MTIFSELRDLIIDEIDRVNNKYEYVQDVFKHSKGKNKVLALIGNKALDLFYYRSEFLKNPDVKKGMIDDNRQCFFGRPNQYIIYKMLELEKY